MYDLESATYFFFFIQNEEHFEIEWLLGRTAPGPPPASGWLASSVVAAASHVAAASASGVLPSSVEASASRCWPCGEVQLVVGGTAESATFHGWSGHGVGGVPDPAVVPPSARGRAASWDWSRASRRSGVIGRLTPFPFLAGRGSATFSIRLSAILE